MPMTLVKQTVVKSIGELTDSEKYKAYENWFQTAGDDFDFPAEMVTEDAKEIGKLLGIQIKHIYYSGFSSQGDGACFEGSYEYQPGAERAVKEYAPLDKDLHGIARDLRLAQRPVFYRACCDIKHRGYYYHELCTEFDFLWKEGRNYSEAEEVAETGVIEALRDFMRWIYSRLEEEYEYRTSYEFFLEEAEHAEMWFDEDLMPRYV